MSEKEMRDFEAQFLSPCVPEGIATMSSEDRAKMFTPEEMRFLVEMAQDVYRGPSDFDREVQKTFESIRGAEG